MYTLSQIRRRVDALKRKLAVPLAVLRLRRLSDDFIDQWRFATGERLPLPETHPFILRIARSGFRFNTFTSLHLYLERCRSQEEIPDDFGIISRLLPQVPAEKLRSLLSVDLPPEEWDDFRSPSRPSPWPAHTAWWDSTALPMETPSQVSGINTFGNLARTIALCISQYLDLKPCRPVFAEGPETLSKDPVTPPGMLSRRPSQELEPSLPLARGKGSPATDLKRDCPGDPAASVSSDPKIRYNPRKPPGILRRNRHAVWPFV